MVPVGAAPTGRSEGDLAPARVVMARHDTAAPRPGCRDRCPLHARSCPGLLAGRSPGSEAQPDCSTRRSATPLRTELRNLTVVFCDLVGSTELSSSIDAEEYSDLIQAYQQQAVTITRHLGGDVEGYSGDGILFRFGWPRAHADDAARALTAALEIVDSVGRTERTRGLSIRVGVHSGPAVVGQLGGADRRATMAVGETLNVSARLQGIANRVRWSPAPPPSNWPGTGSSPPRSDPLQLRGVPDPIDAYRVRRPVG